jgi:hypothetical protein
VFFFPRVAVLTPASITGGRTYLLVTYDPTPAGSYGCQLSWRLDPSLGFVSQYGGANQLEVKQTTGFAPPYAPTWNSIIAASPPVTLGVSGTVNVVAGANAVVNTYACSNTGNGYGLAFVFKLAQWIEQGANAAGVSFFVGQQMTTFTDVFLSYNC